MDLVRGHTPNLFADLKRSGVAKIGTAIFVLSEIILVGATTGCMRSVLIGDAALTPFDSMYSIDRAQYGLTPLPRTGRVFIEGKSSHGGYDAMLHFEGNPSRTVAFRLVGKEYQWLGEQEIFEGPRMYDTPDGRLHERVCITFYKAAVEGEALGLTIDYRGPEKDLVKPKPERPNWSLSLAEVDPLLRRWCFK